TSRYNNIMRDILPKSENKRDYVQHMFARIAGQYDLMNRIISLGQDSVWRRKVVQILRPESSAVYLDLGAGTGDLSYAIIKDAPGAHVVAADLTLGMLLYGKLKKNSQNISWVAADAQALPFKQDTFSGVVSGYLLRNVPDIDIALKEQMRVIRHACKIISLDTTPPAPNLLYPFIIFYLKWIIPLVGWIITRDGQAYSYLPESTRKHLTAESLFKRMQKAGFESIKFEKLMFGTMAIHSGKKPG
ncbi:MAG TPA: ubiquinone/menaquinone biosynthesis methyltransferase, partial [Leptolinea sp.]